MESMIGRGRDAISMIVDPDSFAENQVGNVQVPEGYGPGAVVGTASLNGRPVTILANDAQAVNPRFPSQWSISVSSVWKKPTKWLPLSMNPFWLTGTSLWEKNGPCC